MANYPLMFGIALLLNVVAIYFSSDYYKKLKSKNDASCSAVSDDDDDAATKAAWHKLLKKYMIVYLLATLSDWLQGPYVYALYSDYGYSQHDIAVLFVAGFGSSMIFGSFVGGMADWGGRRAFVLVFALIYAASCVTKHFKDFNILMLGRLLGGIATSLLFSVFDAWLIRSHADANLKQHYLGKSFSWAVFGNSIVAIGAGLVANKAASSMEMKAIIPEFMYIGGYLSPFDISLVTLVACGVAAMSLWEENYGQAEETSNNSGGAAANDDDNNKSGTWYGGLKNACMTTMRRTDILLCGIISSLFEGSMYIFVFMWTPAMTAVTDKDALPFGVIFSTFMVCCMAGSTIYSIQIEKCKGEQLAVAVFGVSALAMVIVAVAGHETVKFIGMNLFEICVGMYWPIMGTMKGSIVPESNRAAVYNLFRIPLNFIVLFSLLTDLTPTMSFGLNAAMLTLATILQYMLMKRREGFGTTSASPSDDDNGGAAATEATQELTQPLVAASAEEV